MIRLIIRRRFSKINYFRRDYWKVETMIKLVYRCRVCHGRFSREHLAGRLPRACPAHRLESKRRVDRAKKRENYARGGPAPKPLCCRELGRKCDQHKQWKRFDQEWNRVTVHQDSVDVLADFTQSLGANGFSIRST